MAINSRTLVAPATKTPLGYGLASVVELRPEPTVGGRLFPQWRKGVTWQNVCPDVDSTYDVCLLSGSIPATGIASPPDKEATMERSVWGASAFTVVGEIDCSPPGFWDDADNILATAFTESEQFAVERIFWTGTVGDRLNTAFPHLAAQNATTDDQGTTLQLAVAQLASAATLDVVEAFGKLEANLSECLHGTGIIHVPVELASHLTANHLLTVRAGVYYSPAGHKVAIGSGYNGTSPSGGSPANILWMYGTGPVFMYRSAGRFIGDLDESLDREVNTLKRIFERTYLLGFDCCLFGVAVSTGGVITGTPLSAT